ncbi:NAD(P)-dependent alcohol dehydrogenase [Natrialba swarupiae]|uniref:NAD(P)-dependent alcohol dehydrogenase n=1 Tax=Natrialba swarupiae TaxID=2448032 RepID=A0A5D5ARF7_9EURY|nr:NAD(P)-dependent alcohol dehydrogenase [Natrialba swarupiae]TYT63587.1 NAD(P)-dependent alcohol dehydrogenase [Natrialba swarupiae]
MDAARLHEYTDEMSMAFSFEELPRPEPERSDDIVVRIEAAGWCHTDNHIVHGDFEGVADINLPHTPGHENAGTVESVGDEVTAVDPGDEVVLHPALTCGTCRSCRLGEEMYCDEHVFCGMDTDGGFAEYMRTSERSAVQLTNVDPVEAAPHADAGLTAYRAVKRARANLVPGDTVLAIGVGGLGHIGIQLLDELTAATIIAADIKDEALALADSADHTVNLRDEEISELVDTVTDEHGIDAILDFVGSDETLDLGLSLLKQGGDHYVVGYGGHVTAPAQAMVGLEINYCGTLCGSFTELQELMSLVEDGQIDVRTVEYPLAEINDVAAKLEDGEIQGRAVLKP